MHRKLNPLLLTTVLSRHSTRYPRHRAQTYCAWVLGCAIASNLQPVQAGVVNLLVENDVFTGTDRHYTSGVMLNYVSEVDRGPERLRKMGVRFPGLEATDELQVSLSLGHEIYTPTNIDSIVLLEDDRPYAGYLYLAAGFTAKNKRALETWRVNLGVVGPAAKAEWAQNALHRLINVDEAEGWDNQLRNEWTLSASYEKKWLHLARYKEWGNTLAFRYAAAG